MLLAAKLIPLSKFHINKKVRDDMADDVFTMEEPDIASFIKDLDLCKQEVRQAVAEGLNEGGKIIAAEMKRLAAPICHVLPEWISAGGIELQKNGKLSIKVGYRDFRSGDWPVIGLIFEHGRPGQSSSTRQSEYRYWHYKTKTGKTVFINQKKGPIQPQPHIRRGFDNKKIEASDLIIRKVEAVQKKAMT